MQRMWHSVKLWTGVARCLCPRAYIKGHPRQGTSFINHHQPTNNKQQRSSLSNSNFNNNQTKLSTTTTTMASPVTIEPPAVQVPAGGGQSVHQLQNTNPEGRYAFKIKSTNNEHYRVNPVFGLLEPGAAAQVEITRLAGPPKNDDRVEVLFMPIDADCTDPKAPFAAGGSPEFKLDVPMVSE